MPNNPFAPPQIDFAGDINDIIQNRRRSLLFQEQQQAYQKKLQTDEARKTALQGLMSGGETDPTKMVMGYLQKNPDDIEGAQTLAQIAHSIRPPMMTEWQQRDLAFRERQSQTSESRKHFEDQTKATDKDTLGFWAANPQKAPDWWRKGMGMNGGDTSDPDQPMRLGPSGDAPPQTKDQYIQRQIIAKKQAEMLGKRPLVDDAEAHKKAINAGYDDALKTIDEMQKTPDSAKNLVLGGMSFMPGLDSNTANFLANLDTLQSQIGLSKFQDLRETSKTGASGFNRLTNFELQQLQQSIASLKRSQTTDQFNQHLAHVKGTLLAAKNRMEHQFAKEYGSELLAKRGKQAASPEPAPGSGVTIDQPQAGAPGETMLPSGIVDYQDFFK